MGKWLKRVGLMVGAILALVLVAALVLLLLGSQRAAARMNVVPEELPIPTDAASIANGERVATIRGCTGCHGDDLSGEVLFDEPVLGRLFANNLTAGQGGVGGDYSDADWVRAIRHGVAPDGRALWIMPADEFHQLSGDDLGDLIAYVKHIPPVDKKVPERALGPIGRIVVGLGQMPIPAHTIDHQAPLAVAPEPAASAEYGAYLVVSCQGCHGVNMTGGQAGPGDPLAPNLTPAGNLRGWNEEQFVQTIRTGATPDGRQLSDAMPWRGFAQLSDLELQAIWRYLHSLPPSS